MKPRQFHRCRSFWFRCFRGPPLPWGHTSWHRFLTRARDLTHIHTCFFRTSPAAPLSFSVCLLLLFVCYFFLFFVWIVYHKSVATVKSVLVIFFLGWFASHTSKIICLFAKMSFFSSSVWICFTVFFHKTNRTLHKIRFSRDDDDDDDALLKIKIQRKTNWKMACVSLKKIFTWTT